MLAHARTMSDAGVSLASIALRRPTLDDVFLALTGHGAVAAPDIEPDRDTKEDAA